VSASQSAQSALAVSGTLVVHARDALFVGRGLPGLRARTCTELPCVTPLAEATTDADGNATLPLPAAIVTIDGTTVDRGPPYDGEAFRRAIPTNVFYPSPGQASLEADVFDPYVLFVAAQLGDVSLVEGRGVVDVRVLDCAGTPAPDATLSLVGADPSTVARYAATGQPVAAGHRATDSSGSGILFNVPAGAFRISVRDVVTGVVVASHEGYVPADGTTHLELEPAR
jgi:hypothetical protein